MGGFVFLACGGVGRRGRPRRGGWSHYIGVVMEATGAVVAVTQKVEGCEPDYTLGESLWIGVFLGVFEARIAR